MAGPALTPRNATVHHGREGGRQELMAIPARPAVLRRRQGAPVNLKEILTDLFLDSNDFRDWHTIPIGERLQTVGAAPEQVAELERAWQSALDTHRGTLRRLWHDDTTADDFASSTGTDTRVPTQAELAELTDEQLLESIEACETSLHGCQNAISLLNTREGGTHADFLLGEEAPSELFRQLADWFESALVVLR